MNDLISTFGIQSREGLSEADVLCLVQVEILRLLQNDREKLLNIAYRLDIDEEKFRSCFRLGESMEDIAALLTRFFFDREKAKAAYRHVHDKH